MADLTVKIPNVRLLIKDRKLVFWAFVSVISVLVFIILCLIISKQPCVRNFEDHPLTSYQAGCADLTSQWHVGETGTKGTIKV